MDTNTLNRALARIIIAADRAGLPATATADVWQIRNLTPEGQWQALYRWEVCMRTWPNAQDFLAA
ncbi:MULTISPECIES: hypothetical protein [Nocardioides]|uniref:Uncharacterized protein n=1 Tax=Nocardioides vastitatis TaxID=2568655 RepID=A0ABW0ZJ87_9ACTN|nr:hypothetical protein [Nocardioides sp.]THJ13711.1 hypothetical protein E7Z54_01500 [Nocardioides sp.]